jgi:hypothetical protein
MSASLRLTGRLIAAARVLAGVSQSDFAAAVGIEVDDLCRVESAGSAWVPHDDDVPALMSGLAIFGIVIVDESDGMGAGVRLKFSREDVKRLGILEGEGGLIASDDAP